MPFAEADLLPLSALQHLLFCERQCALIHLERVWVENRFTVEGRILHRNAHEGKAQTRHGVRITRGLPLASRTLGLAGQADVIEWRPPEGVSDREADRSLAAWLRERTRAGLTGWTVTPIEYKRGRPKTNDCDRVQLCAQALCLEEMLAIHVPVGQLFYGVQRRRFDVDFEDSLRSITTQAAVRLHEIFHSGRTPHAVREKKCETCSLLPICLPDAMNRPSATRYFQRQLQAALSSDLAAPASDILE
ncbi:MAG: CRISPR-associated protein Cas4 [Planctomycetaceae bacterium]|nr:CRISPR-associated protein Cas4 [Planctomycetaceae bacterium]